MSKVAVALLQGFAASNAEPIFAGYAHATIQRSIALYRAVPCQVEKVTVADFEYTLVHDILTRPVHLSAHQGSLWVLFAGSQYPEL